MPSPRILPNLLDAWNEYSEPLPANPHFKKWGGLFLLSAALTRRVWIHANEIFPHLYPNLFVLLVGRPGTGKDIVINNVAGILEKASVDIEPGKGFYIGEESLSAKGLIDSLASDESELSMTLNGTRIPEIVQFHSIISCIPELGTFMPEYNTQLVSILNELYNCKDRFRDRIRGGIHKGQRTEIKNPHVALFLGTQPSTMAEIFPEQAFQMGFFSRTFIVYGQELYRQRLYGGGKHKGLKKLWSHIVSDIKSIAYVTGEMEVSPDAQDAINSFHISGCDKTALSHSRFADYNTRRSLHAQKLAMLFSMAESSDKIVEFRHWQRALELLLETEKKMPSAFAGLVSSKGFHSTVEEVVHSNTGGKITHQELERSLRKNHKPYEVGQIIRSMLMAGDLVQVSERCGFPVYEIRGNSDELV